MSQPDGSGVMARPAVADVDRGSWSFAEGDEIVPGRTAVELLGGGTGPAWRRFRHAAG